MSKATYTARANTKAAITALAVNVTIQQDVNRRFKSLFILQLGACYNNTQPGEGMHKLADARNNALTITKSTD